MHPQIHQGWWVCHSKHVGLELAPDLEMVYWGLALSGNLFHSSDTTVVKLLLQLTFLGQIKETDGLFPGVRLSQTCILILNIIHGIRGIN